MDDHIQILQEQYQDRLDSLYKFIYAELPMKLMSEDSNYEDLQMKLYNLVERGLKEESEGKLNQLINEYAILKLDHRQQNQDYKDQISLLQEKIERVQYAYEDQRSQKQQLLDTGDKENHPNTSNQVHKDPYKNLQKKFNRALSEKNEVQVKLDQLQFEKQKFLDEIQDLSTYKREFSHKNMNQYIHENEQLKKQNQLYCLQLKELQINQSVMADEGSRVQEAANMKHFYLNKIESIQNQFFGDLNLAKQKEILAKSKLQELELRLHKQSQDNDQSLNLDKSDQQLKIAQQTNQQLQVQIEQLNQTKINQDKQMQVLRTKIDQQEKSHSIRICHLETELAAQRTSVETEQKHFTNEFHELKQLNEDLTMQLDTAENQIEYFNVEYEKQLSLKQDIISQMNKQQDEKLELQEKLNQYSQKLDENRLNLELTIAQERTSKDHQNSVLQDQVSELESELDLNNRYMHNMKLRQLDCVRVIKIQVGLINNLGQECHQLRENVQQNYNFQKTHLSQAFQEISAHHQKILLPALRDIEFKEIQIKDIYNDKIQDLNIQMLSLSESKQHEINSLKVTLQRQEAQMVNLKNQMLDQQQEISTREALDQYQEKKMNDIQSHIKQQSEESQTKLSELEAQLKMAKQNFIKESTRWEKNLEVTAREKDEEIQLLQQEMDRQQEIYLEQQRMIVEMSNTIKEQSNTISLKSQDISEVRSQHKKLYEQRENLDTQKLKFLENQVKDLQYGVQKTPSISFSMKEESCQARYDMDSHDKEQLMKDSLSAQERQITEFRNILEQTKKKFSKPHDEGTPTFKVDKIAATQREIQEIQKFRRSLSRNK